VGLGRADRVPTRTGVFSLDQLVALGTEYRELYRATLDPKRESLAAKGVSLLRVSDSDTAFESAVGRGNLHFSDNSCFLSLLSEDAGRVPLAVVLATMDDLQFSQNQCHVVLRNGTIVANTLLMGASLRASSNRFVENPETGFFSLVTVGLMNTTTGNQATHCIGVLPEPGPSRMSISHANTVLLSDSCKHAPDEDTTPVGTFDPGVTVDTKTPSVGAVTVDLKEVAKEKAAEKESEKKKTTDKKKAVKTTTKTQLKKAPK
jgi:hypothetical protein